MKTLLLNQHEISQLLPMDAAIAAVTEAYKAFNQNMVAQPPIVSIEIPEHNGEIDIKASYSKAIGVIAVKTAVGFWNNPQTYGLPTGLAVIILFDAKNGFPLCIMDGNLITSFRTGAAGGVSAKVLARENSEIVGVIGAGNQARMQVMALTRVVPVKTVKVWSPIAEERTAYRRDMEASLGLEIVTCEDPQSAVSGSDIVVTATPGRKPIVSAKWISPGTHIIAIGADMPGKQELDAKIFPRAKVVADSIQQCIERGETQNAIRSGSIVTENIYAEIGQILLGQKAGRENDQEITLFDSTGLSVQDIATAAKVYQQAVTAGYGTKIELF
ncbi:MAG TPA: ornithine cyclodeaminase family protein [Negativicutes bacterium]|nr:ornithine cyclodeaminase family protein [Negativicutes bacterium]